jgi:hypothetical protein
MHLIKNSSDFFLQYENAQYTVADNEGVTEGEVRISLLI